MKLDLSSPGCLPSWVGRDLAALEAVVRREGGGVRVGGAWLPASGEADAAGVAESLYAAWYLRWAPPGRGAAPGPLDLDPVRAYRAANAPAPARGTGWTVEAASTSGRLLVVGDGERLLVEPGDYVTRPRPGDRGQPGDAVAVTLRRDDLAMQPGSWVTSAPGFSLTGPLLRLYWRVDARSAARVVAALTAELGDLPYALKATATPEGFGRADGVVLYLLQDLPGPPADAAAAVGSVLSRRLVDGLPPALTRPVGPGVGIAEGPGDGSSFGQARCAVVASAVVKWAADGGSLVTTVVEELRHHGLDPSRPHLGPGSTGTALAELADLLGRAGGTARGESNGAADPPHGRRVTATDGAASGPATAGPGRPLDPAPDLVEEAARLADQVASAAIWHEGRCCWLGCSSELAGGRWRPTHRALGGGLYAGSAGIGLFLAHVWRQTADPRLAECARGAVAHALDCPDRDRSDPSLCDGVAGAAWAAARVAEVLDDEALAARADAVHDELLASVERAPPPGDDLLSGRAGLVLAALAAPRRPLDLARRLGDELVARAVPQALGVAWPSPGAAGEPPLCGLAHGASGVAAALYELAHATGEERYAGVARLAVLYERAWFDREACNWPDLRDWGWAEQRAGRPPPCPVYWCHGAIGIGAARLRAWQLGGDDLVLADLTAALHAARAQVASLLRADADADPFAANVSVCHGASGVAQLLVDAHAVLGHRHLLDLARQLGRWMVATYPAAGRPYSCGVAGGWETPGMMLGLAGVGLTLLRLADPSAVPSLGLALVSSPG